MFKIVLDTNILVSASIHRGNEFELLRQARLGKVQVFLSHQILNEYLDVIARKKFGFSISQRKEAFKQILSTVRLVMPDQRVRIVEADPADNRILECALCAKADLIVSGDSHLLTLKEFRGMKIVSSREALRMMDI
ncbi:MAG: putative toxin-antitoxin system toxin component, PIN family [Nanoarchaeota archaeon]